MTQRTQWWADPLRRSLQSLLSWVDQKEQHAETHRRDVLGFWRREVHVPIPIVTVVSALILYCILLPEVGLQFHRMLALFGMVTLLVIFFVVYFRYDFPELVNDDAIFLTGLSLILGVLLIEVGRTLPRLPFYGVPIGVVAMVVTLLLHMRLALLISIILAILAGVLNRFSFECMLITFLSSAAGILATRQVRHRNDIMRAGFHVAWVTILGIGALGLFYEWTLHLMVVNVGWGALNGFLCAVLTLGLLPVLESFFSRITNITLLEIGDFNRPLLRRLMLEAPGTYHHTLLVASLAEQAAEAIGANSLLCRVGMYYHDVGKLLHPEYFIENETMRRDPNEKSEHHEKLNPSISSLIIMSHVKEGVALARSHKVPEEVLRFIPEHHGTSLIKYFYMRALAKEDDQPPTADSYRYPGPKPRSRETVIGMLADSVEAASRTLEEPSYERLKDLVEKIVNGKFMDGQLDNAPVTLQDLRKIILSFTSTLSAIYHVRIHYPETPESPDERRLPTETP